VSAWFADGRLSKDKKTIRGDEMNSEDERMLDPEVDEDEEEVEKEDDDDN
jgi:hypothetical protein